MKDISLPGKPTIVCLVLVLALLSSGCAMKAYEGPELPKSEIAVLHTVHTHTNIPAVILAVPVPVPVPSHKHATAINRIDGREITLPKFIHVLAGNHTVGINYWRYPDTKICVSLPLIPGSSCNYDYFTRDLAIDFTAKAGHEYRFPAERRGERNWIWVEDVTGLEFDRSGKVVAGEKPPEVKAKGKEPASPPEEP